MVVGKRFLIFWGWIEGEIYKIIIRGGGRAKDD